MAEPAEPVPLAPVPTATQSETHAPGATAEPEGLRLWVRAGARRVEGVGEAPEAVPVEGRGGVGIVLTGGEAGARIELQVGRSPLAIRLDAQGAGKAEVPDVLEAAAGRVRIAVVSPPGPRVELEVHPVKLDLDQVRALVAELDALAPGLGADLGGRAEQGRAVGEAATETAESRLARLERAVGLALSASSAVRTQPLCTVREVAQAVPSPGGSTALAAADVRWLARAPAAIRAQAVHPQVAVRRIRKTLFDLPENRGIVGFFGNLERALDATTARIEAERARIESGRSARSRFQTSEANLFDELDRPRLLGCDRRTERIARLRADVGHARWRTGLPATLPAAPRLARSAAVEARPGYWQMYQAQAALEGAGELPLEARFAPIASLDELYELWCVVQVASALAAAVGRPLAQVLRLDHDGWFVQVPEGEVARLDLPDGRRLRLLRGPRYAFRPRPMATFERVERGGPLWPDLVIQEDTPDGRGRLHVFDAKYRTERDEPDACPWSSLRGLWLKYGEGIGHGDTGLPAVASVWILYPGRAPAPRLAQPAMLHPQWPAARLRGGAVALSPGHNGALGPVLAALLGPRPAAGRPGGDRP